MSALAQDLDQYDPAAIHMSEVTFDRMREVTADLRRKTAAQRRENPVVHPGRADVIAAGSTVVEQIIAYADALSDLANVLVSEKDILDGIVLGMRR